MDPLADVLDVTRVDGSVLANVRAHAPWGIRLAPIGGAAFHAVTEGSCWLSAGDGAPVPLAAGDVVLLPTGAGHTLTSEPGVRAQPYDRLTKERMMTPDGDLVLPGHGAAADLLCAAFDYDHEVAHPLLSLLPPVVRVAVGDSEPAEATLRLLVHELGHRHAGSRAVVDRLIDVLFVHVVRAWIERDEDGRASWLRGLRDPAVATVLALLHDRPQAPWTVAELAREVNLSRAALARRFSEAVGEPPLAYLTRWRMDLAARALRQGAAPVETIAHSVGYSSEYAFSRAFSRLRGQPPGRYRRLARERTAALAA
jgi:AraC-like DNA-binding protein